MSPEQQQFVASIHPRFDFQQDIHPAYAAANFECGATLLNHADSPASALPYFERALDLKADFAEAAVNAGLALKAMDRVPEAIAMLQQGVTLNPEMAAAHANLGVILQDVGRLSEAITAYVSLVH